MIDSVLASPSEGGAAASEAPSPTSGGSDLNLGSPIDGTGGGSGAERATDLIPESPAESSITLPQNVGKPPINSEELPVGEVSPGEQSEFGKAAEPSPSTPTQPSPREPSPRELAPEKKPDRIPDNQISQPAEIPSSSLNILPSVDTHGDMLETSPGSSEPPLPSTLMIDPKGAEAVQPSEPILDGPPPSIPMLLPESQAPIKSDLFPMSGGGRDSGAGNQGGILSLFGARLGLPGGYLGLRMGGAFVTPLAKKFTRLGTYGVLVEVRQGSWAGMRFAYDVVPDFRSDVVSQSGPTQLETVVSWRKLQIGWALAYNTRLFFDMFHVSPSVGVYGVSATAPLTTDLDGVPEQRSFSVDRVVNFGLEVDAEKIIFGDSILRLWISRFMTFGAATALTKSTVKDARMTRAGADLFVKGPKVSRKFNLSYLGFMSLDSMEIVTRDPDLLDPMVVVQMPFLGFGTSLAW